MWLGSSGTLVPGFEARLVSPEGGREVSKHDKEGELWLKSPSIVLGYFNNDKANQSTFEGPWLKTGDVAVFRKSPSGSDHLWIVDRLKELIKTKVHSSNQTAIGTNMLTWDRETKWHRLN